MRYRISHVLTLTLLSSVALSQLYAGRGSQPTPIEPSNPQSLRSAPIMSPKASTDPLHKDQSRVSVSTAGQVTTVYTNGNGMQLSSVGPSTFSVVGRSPEGRGISGGMRVFPDGSVSVINYSTGEPLFGRINPDSGSVELIDPQTETPFTFALDPQNTASSVRALGPRVDLYSDGATTRFPDGTTVDTVPRSDSDFDIYFNRNQDNQIRGDLSIFPDQSVALTAPAGQVNYGSYDEDTDAVTIFNQNGSALYSFSLGKKTPHEQAWDESSFIAPYQATRTHTHLGPRVTVRKVSPRSYEGARTLGDGSIERFDFDVLPDGKAFAINPKTGQDLMAYYEPNSNVGTIVDSRGKMTSFHLGDLSTPINRQRQLTDSEYAEMTALGQSSKGFNTSSTPMGRNRYFYVEDRPGNELRAYEARIYPDENQVRLFNTSEPEVKSGIFDPSSGRAYVSEPDGEVYSLLLQKSSP